MARLQERVAKSPLRLQDKAIAMTFSAGLAQFRDDENGHALLRRADEALYAAKEAGRNCIKVAE
jgi:diguanylate cyclase